MNPKYQSQYIRKNSEKCSAEDIDHLLTEESEILEKQSTDKEPVIRKDTISKISSLIEDATIEAMLITGANLNFLINVFSEKHNFFRFFQVMATLQRQKN